MLHGSQTILQMTSLGQKWWTLTVQWCDVHVTWYLGNIKKRHFSTSGRIINDEMNLKWKMSNVVFSVVTVDGHVLLGTQSTVGAEMTKFGFRSRTYRRWYSKSYLSLHHFIECYFISMLISLLWCLQTEYCSVYIEQKYSMGVLWIIVIRYEQDDRHCILYMVQKKWNVKMTKKLHGYAVFTV